MTSFASWLGTFLNEKGTDLGTVFEIKTTDGWDTHIITAATVVDAAKSASPAEQETIKDTLVRIDFLNGDVLHYLRHLAECLVRARFGDVIAEKHPAA